MKNTKDTLGELSLYDCEFLSQLKGKKIVDIGFLTHDSPNESIEGGLTIDYIDENKVKRMILGHNELGMWLSWNGEKGVLNQEDILKNKVEEFQEKFNWDFKKTIMKENALKLTYSIEGNVSLDLSIKDIKIIGLKIKEIVAEFGKKDKDLEKIVGLLNDYVYMD